MFHIIRGVHDDAAKERKAAGRKRGNKKPDVENLPPRETHKKSRDAAAEVVNVSGKRIALRHLSQS